MSIDVVIASELLRNLSLALSGPLGAILAWRGLKTWKDEKRWQKNYGLTEDLLVLLYRRSSALNDLRSERLMSGYSFNQETHDGATRERQREFERVWELYIFRTKFLDEIHAEMYSKIVHLGILIGDDQGDNLANLIADLADLEKEIWKPLSELILRLRPSGFDIDSDNKKFAEDTRRWLYSQTSRDQFTKKYDEAYVKAEQFLKGQIAGY